MPDDEAARAMARRVIAETQGPQKTDEYDEHGLVGPEEPLTLQNAGDRMMQYPSTLVKHATPEEAQANDLELQKARIKAELFALPKAAWLTQNVPGMQSVAKAFQMQQEKAAGVRQPIQMQREFSNDQEKQAYLDRVKQALDVVKK